MTCPEGFCTGWALPCSRCLPLAACGSTICPKRLEELENSNTHKSVGVFILSLMLRRLVWRFANPTPQPLAYDPKGGRISALGADAVVFLADRSTNARRADDAGGRSSGAAIRTIRITNPGRRKQGPRRDAARNTHSREAGDHRHAARANRGRALKQHFIQKNRTLTRMVSD